MVISGLLQFCCHLLSPPACHEDAQVFCFQRSPNWTHVPPGTYVPKASGIPPTPSILARPYAVNEIVWCIFPGMAGLSFNQPLQPTCIKYPITMWNPSWWISKCLHWQVTTNWKNLYASLNICWYKYLCSPESLLTCFRDLWFKVFMKHVFEWLMWKNMRN